MVNTWSLKVIKIFTDGNFLYEPVVNLLRKIMAIMSQYFVIRPSLRLSVGCALVLFSRHCIFYNYLLFPLPSNRQRLSYGDCLEGKRGDYLTSFVLLCIRIVHIICTPI